MNVDDFIYSLFKRDMLKFNASRLPDDNILAKNLMDKFTKDTGIVVKVMRIAGQRSCIPV